MKMNKRKKRHGEWVTLSCAHKWKDNKQLSPGGIMIKEQKQLLGIKKANKMEEQKQLASWCTSFEKIALCDMELNAFTRSTCSIA